MSEKILIVDDVSKNIQILGHILSQKDYQIAYAQNGQQAIDICKIQEFDLILLDIMMPGLDGYSVCKTLKSNPKTFDIPIIFLTAKADMDSIIKGFETGGQDYITKPFNAAELLARVQNHLLIKSQREQLKEINENLESRVRERTSQLERANHKLEVLDLAKSNFLSVISHEIRTPLNGLIGITELLAQSDVNKDQREFITNLKEVSKRLMKFSETALLITSLKIDSYKPEILPVSLSNIISDSIAQFRQNQSDSNLEIITSLPKDDILVVVDSELIRTCFTMVIENSHAFSVSNPELEISLNLENNKANITFVDNGPGFSKSALSNLFDLFSSGDILHSEGSGLGLAAVKLALDVQEASIKVENDDLKGAKVVISLDYKDHSS